MSKKRTWRWVTRDRDGRLQHVFIWRLARPKPRLADDGFWEATGKLNDSVIVCPKEFKYLFGFLPPTDRPIKVEFSAKVVE